MDNVSLALFLIALAAVVLCGGGGLILLFLMIVGFVMLRRRGRQNVTVKDAVAAGAESVSQVFVRGGGGLETYDDEDDD